MSPNRRVRAGQKEYFDSLNPIVEACFMQGWPTEDIPKVLVRSSIQQFLSGCIEQCQKVTTSQSNIAPAQCEKIHIEPLPLVPPERVC